MQSRPFIVALVIVLAALAGYGAYRQSALQRNAAIQGSGPIQGVTMIHFWATW